MKTGVLISAMLTALVSFSANADRISLVADVWCPFNCEPGSAKPGYLIEVAKRALAIFGHTVVYKTSPWSRAILEVSNGTADGLVGAGPTEVSGFIFPDTSLAIARHTLFTLPDSDWTFSGYPSLRKIKLGIIDSYSYGKLEEDYITPNRHHSERLMIMSGENNLGRYIDLLKRNRIDSFVEEEAVVRYYLRQSHQEDTLRSAGIIYREPIYIAFSPANPASPRYARQLSEGIKKLRENGELQRIASQYNISLPHD